jgi:hypothetical protein
VKLKDEAVTLPSARLGVDAREGGAVIGVPTPP